MDLNLFHSLEKSITENSLVSKLLKTFEQKLNENTDLSLIESHLYTLDRFEGNVAVCEDRETKEMLDIPISQIPENAVEGDILSYENNSLSIEKEKTQEARKSIQDLVNSLRK